MKNFEKEMQNGGQISLGFFLKNFFVLGGGRRRNFEDVVFILLRFGDINFLKT
jgi:hypothetical protein